MIKKNIYISASADENGGCGRGEHCRRRMRRSGLEEGGKKILASFFCLPPLAVSFPRIFPRFFFFFTVKTRGKRRHQNVGKKKEEKKKLTPV